MNRTFHTRRNFLASTAVTSAAATFPTLWTAAQANVRSDSPNERVNVAAIGVGRSGSVIAQQASHLGNMVAACDVDGHHVHVFPGRIKGDCKTHSDNRTILDQNGIQDVTIGTPDHWHAKIAIEAMQSGKDVYYEKPLTLTIDEGKLISKVVKETGRVMQVGTQQRSEYKSRFLKAIDLARSGLLGQDLHATASIDVA